VTTLPSRLKERRIVQWSLAYLAGAWLVVQVLDALAEPWGIPLPAIRLTTLVLAAGFPAAVGIAWYHGEKGRQRVSGPELLMLAGIAGIAALLVGLLQPGAAPNSEPSGAPAGEVRENTVAVVPCLDLSPEGDQRHFSDGVAVEIISALRRDGRVQVAGQSSSFAMRGRPAPEVGLELKVAAVLECSVRTEGDSMRVEATLADAGDGFALWTREFDRPIANILRTQAEIAAAVVEEITGQRSEVDQGIRTVDPDAYRVYLRGRLAWDRRGEADMRQARDYFQQAIEIDPDFAPARAGIADTYAVMAFYNYLPPEEAFPAARREARAALEIDPSLPEALATQAYVALYWDWEWSAAEAGFRRAIAEADGYATAHQWLGNVLVVTGRTAEGTTEFQHAWERDPGSVVAQVGIGWTQYYDRRFQEVVEWLDDYLDEDPRYMLAHYWRSWALTQLGDARGAVASMETAVELSDSAAITVAGLAGAYARMGRTTKARSLLGRLQDPVRTPALPLYEIAKVHLALGDRDEAFRWLEQAYEARALQLVFIGVDPEVDPLRDDPRLADLLSRMNLD
jgi:TolB-like protein/Tfp pilus assembly protein PilF